MSKQQFLSHEIMDNFFVGNDTIYCPQCNKNSKVRIWLKKYDKNKNVNVHIYCDNVHEIIVPISSINLIESILDLCHGI